MVAASAPPRAAYLVRHGAMRLIGEFTPLLAAVIEPRREVIVRTDRGLEWGEVLCESTPRALALVPEPTFGELLRVATAEDRQHREEIRQREPQHYAKAVELIASHRLPMQLVQVEELFGGERVIFYFLAENRVDFRELVKSLAREFRTRIELRQIGVRDEAKLLADYGDCGKPVCCNTHMTAMPPVSMRMAKIQKATLDPAKIAGRCGRLKCCLRFEQDVYDEFLQELPPVGTRILTAKGQGRVIAQEVLAKRLLVEFEDGRRLSVPAQDVLTRL